MPFDVHKCFMPECYLDTNLVEVLLECQDAVNHKKGNSSVIEAMAGDRMKDNFVVGLIDDDKVKVKRLEEFKKIERLWKQGLKMFKHPDKSQYVIQVSPAIEKWLLNECVKGGISPEEYSLPTELEGLRALKGLSQRKDERFRKLFRSMLENEKCDEIKELKRWLIFLRETNYKTNLDLL